ncbi:MAG: tRNA(Ile)-lysidine synthase [Acidobacteriota bacterium]|jgi:tRNA(Ile)-lysidine synthase|nr:tRNA(Ile)-lysidine synthase [Acidobacteriota bacterium]
MSVAGGEVKGGPGRFARRLLRVWRLRGWPLRGERVLVAVSGGADSTALLLALEELRRVGLLGVEVVAAHLDHGLRGERGAGDARWVEGLARDYGFECIVGRASVSERAREGRDNLEQAARRARYEFLAEAAHACGASAVLAAHTLDDQAETVLLRLLRGSGADGLGGMMHERPLEAGGEVSLRRPLLAWARRADTEGYCRERGVEFRSDAMNDDERFARVRVRRKLLPLLSTFNPRAAEALARTASLLREDSAALNELAAALLEAARAQLDTESEEVKAGEAVWVAVLARAAPALRRRALRLWLARARGDLRRLSRAHLRGVERLLEGERGGRVAELPGGSRVERRRGLLHFRPGAETSGGDES